MFCTVLLSFWYTIPSSINGWFSICFVYQITSFIREKCNRIVFCNEYKHNTVLFFDIFKSISNFLSYYVIQTQLQTPVEYLSTKSIWNMHNRVFKEECHLYSPFDDCLLISCTSFCIEEIGNHLHRIMLKKNGQWAN